jgi:carbonic anhydrase
VLQIFSSEGRIGFFAIPGAHMKSLFLTLAILVLLLVPSIAQQPAAAPALQSTYHAATKQQPSANKIWRDLMEGNKRFVAGKPNARQLVGLRKSLAKVQHPNVVVLTCSDSRVPPELLFDQSLGDLFVVRTAGNVADQIGVGSIEYAVEHLGSSVLVVLGHTKCGAVTAACSGDEMPTSNLKAIMEKIDPAVSRARKTGVDGDALVEAAIKENVHQSAKNVLAHSEILRRFMDEGRLTVFEAEYQLDTGEVIRLPGELQ